jgi:holin-like protein
MILIKQVAIILGFWLMGETISFFTNLPIPGSIVAMLLIVVALEFKVIKSKDINRVCDFLLNNMALFFIPAGVGIMLHFEVIKQEWLPISIAIIVSCLLVLTVVGLMMEKGKK